jgi:hypothetical protein
MKSGAEGSDTTPRMRVSMAIATHTEPKVQPTADKPTSLGGHSAEAGTGDTEVAKVAAGVAEELGDE